MKDDEFDKMMKYFILAMFAIVLLAVSGCAKITPKLIGDDPIIQGKIKEMSSEITGIKEASLLKDSEINGIKQASMQAEGQIGLINKTLEKTINKIDTLVSNMSSGRDSIMNDPDMIKYMIKTLGQAAGILIISFMIILGIVMLMLRALITNVSDSLDKFIEKLDKLE